MLSSLITFHLKQFDATANHRGVLINGRIYPFVNHPPIQQPFFHVGIDQYWPIPKGLVHLFTLDNMILASSNAGKVMEYQTFLKEESISLARHPLSLDIHENKHTFYENALIKSHHAAQFEREGQVVLADDSGFCLSSVSWDDVEIDVENAQGVFPGVYTKRFAKALDPNIDYCLAAQWLSNQFELPIAAYFECAIALSKRHKGLTLSLLFRGQVHGQCVKYQEGPSGFGFDPVFIPEGHQKTFSQMTIQEKNTISHRARAIQSLKKYFTSSNES